MKRSKGFTLIELMIIIAILGIICALIVPRISKELDDKKAAIKPVVVTQPAAAKPAAPAIMDKTTEEFKSR